MDKADLCSEKGDSVAEAHIGTNVLNYAPGASHIPAEWKSDKFVAGKSFSERRQTILANIKDLREQAASSETKDERAAFDEGLKMEIAALKALNEEQSAEEGAPEDDIETN
eukprot:Nitzschia sp. Nitz4//scaffold326_size20077//18//350//NITZ4_008707-RA/size20077-exonerate_est2genome-gene-0.12-mRNA-1//1//CDS//3329547915//8972//frame0